MITMTENMWYAAQAAESMRHIHLMSHLSTAGATDFNLDRQYRPIYDSTARMNPPPAPNPQFYFLIHLWVLLCHPLNQLKA